jgi:uncharacterized protein
MHNRQVQDPGDAAPDRMPAVGHQVWRRVLFRLAAPGFAMACSACFAAPPEAQPPLPDEVAHAIRQAYGDGEIGTFDAAVDLSGDGKPEIVVYVVGPMVCGTGGCNLLVFTPTQTGSRRVADISVVRPPIRASSATSSGWRNLVVHVSGGGARDADVELAFDGRSYPANPTVRGPRVRPAQLAGAQMLIDDFRSMDEGRLLGAAAPRHDDAVPSFDCAKARIPSEKRICGDANLARLDRKLAETYAKGLSASSAWTDDDRRSSRDAQRSWLAQRDRCAKAADVTACFTEVYQRRIAELQIRNGDLGPVPPTVEYRCSGLKDSTVTAVYYSQTEIPSAVITAGGKQTIAFLARSGSGARYLAPGVEIWEHQGEARLNWARKSYACKTF